MNRNFNPRCFSKLRIKFVVTSLHVGGAETLLLNLIRGMDKTAFAPEVVCLKEAGVLGQEVGNDVPIHTNLLRSKWDFRVLFKLRRILDGSTDAVITVGAGDKMFWGRLAAKWNGIPVICSALHSTGWPDGIGRLNRMLTQITDAFIACAQNHAEYLVTQEGFPSSRVFMIPNGVDTNRFRPKHPQRQWLREQLGVPTNCNLVGIVAALRPEKNHQQFVVAAREVVRQHPNTHFVIVGDGPERASIEDALCRFGLTSHIHLLGNRQDTPELLAGFDVFCLTSRNEANPVSILEALACCVPVVSPDVGSIRETVVHKKTGLLSKPLCAESTADAIVQLLGNPQLAASLGRAGRQLVREAWSLESMVSGYENLIETLFNSKLAASGRSAWKRPEAKELPANVNETSGLADQLVASGL